MSEVSFLDNQLETYIHDMRSTKEFSTLKGIRQLAEKMVEMKKKKMFHIYSTCLCFQSTAATKHCLAIC